MYCLCYGCNCDPTSYYNLYPRPDSHVNNELDVGNVDPYPERLAGYDNLDVAASELV
jgi:hypothetical protein